MASYNPSSISDFDENDGEELPSVQVSNGTIMDPNNMVHAEMFKSLLYQVCAANTKDTKERDKVYHLICQKFSKNKLLPPQEKTDMFSSVRLAYTKAFTTMLQTSLQLVQGVESETHLRSLPATERERTAVLLQFQNIHSQPKILPEEIIFRHKTRYQTEFKELHTLGKGGFGKVYKVRSNLDRQHYAIKKIRLKHKNCDQSLKLVKEVQVLAGLKHSNVVGYNTSWIEPEPMHPSNYQERKPRGLKSIMPSSSESFSPRSSSENESSTQDRNRVSLKDLEYKQSSTGRLSENMKVPESDTSCSPIKMAGSPNDSSSTITNSPFTSKLLDTSFDDGDRLPVSEVNTQQSSVTQSSVSMSLTTYSSTRSCTTSMSKFASQAGTSTRMATEEVVYSKCESTKQTNQSVKITEMQEDYVNSFSTETNENHWSMEEEYDDISIHFESEPNDYKSNSNDYAFGRETSSDSSQSNAASFSGKNRQLSKTDNNNYTTEDQPLISYDPFSFSFEAPVGKLPMVKSSGKIIDLDLEGPDEQMKPKHDRQRTRHRSKSQDGIKTNAHAGVRTLSLEQPSLPFPGFYVILHIQMQLCSLTLAEWLRDRNMKDETALNTFDLVDPYDNMNIFQQILHGIEYIHAQNVIHRDLKPKNIFLESKGTDLKVLIGDFGLAKEAFYRESRTQNDSANPHFGRWDKFDPTSHTAHVGTTTYASPEQLKGTKCDDKSDMYSSGIILCELFHPFGTAMERAKVMGDVRKGCIHKEIHTRWLKQYKAIEQLTHSDCCQRPNAAQVLRGPLFQSNEEVISNLRTKLSEQDEEIRQLKLKLAEMEIQLGR